jgi:hypothetical protein
MLKFSKNVFLQEKIGKENEEYFEIFWIFLKMESSKLINHLANMCESHFLFFWGQKSKVSQPKVKKGKNVSMVSCLISVAMLH